MKPKAALPKCAGLVVSIAAVAMLTSGCEMLGRVVHTTTFDQRAFDTAQSLKTQSLGLIDKARNHTTYSDVAKQDEQLMEQFDSAIADEQSKRNDPSALGQLKTVKTEMRRVLDLWKSKGKLSPAFVAEKKKQVEKHFETLLSTEKEKRGRR
jgi:hypothetical protein